MIGVVVDYDLIAGPVPIGDDGVVVGENAPVEIVEPEAFAIAALEVEDVMGTEASCKAAACPGVIQVKAGVVAATFVADPLIVTNVHVGQFRMSLMVGWDVMLFGLMVRFGVRWFRLMSGSGVRAVRRDVSTANFRMASTMWLALVSPLLCKDNQA